MTKATSKLLENIKNSLKENNYEFKKELKIDTWTAVVQVYKNCTPYAIKFFLSRDEEEVERSILNTLRKCKNIIKVVKHLHTRHHYTDALVFPFYKFTALEFATVLNSDKIPEFMFQLLEVILHGV